MKIPEPALKSLACLIREGVEQSADTLIEMTQRQWAVEVKSVDVIPGKRLQDSLPNGFQEHHGVYFDMPGGMLLVLLSKASGSKLIGAHLGSNAEKMRAVPNLETEVIGEIIQIIANKLVARLADVCGVGFLMSAPEVAFGTKNYLYSEISRKFPNVTRDLAITTFVHMAADKVSTDCLMYILLDEQLTGRILHSLENPASGNGR